MAKVWRFKKEFEDAIISIPGKRLIITRFNANSDIIRDLVKKFPKYRHNFESVADEVDGDQEQPEEIEMSGPQGDVANTTNEDTAEPGEITQEEMNPQVPKSTSSTKNVQKQKPSSNTKGGKGNKK